MINKMWGLLETFTDESQRAALFKCDELGFDKNSGEVSLDVSYINLRLARDILKDAIKEKKLIQLPITIQKIIFASLEKIAACEAKLIEGSDEVGNLSEAIEGLYTEIWQYGLHNLSDEIIGYQTKMNQLKNMELATEEAKKKLEEGILVKENLEQILGEAGNHSELLQAHVTNAKTSATEANNAFAQTLETNQKTLESFKTVLQCEKTSNDLIKTSKINDDEILSMKKKSDALILELTSLKDELEESKNTQNDELEKNKNKQKELFGEFEGYREKIDGLLGDANRTGMAASFTRRKKDLIIPMIIWIVMFSASILGLVFMGIKYLAPILANGNLEQLPSRLALTAPFIWLGWFSAKQYGYTSRLHEDYAYKEASAMSFEGFKREAGEIDDEMLKNLLDTAIKNLGDNPIRIYSGHVVHASPLHEIVDKTIKDVKPMDLLKAIIPKDKEKD